MDMSLTDKEKVRDPKWSPVVPTSYVCHFGFCTIYSCFLPGIQDWNHI